VIPEGASVRVTGKSSDGFYPVTYLHLSGWAHGDFLVANAKQRKPAALPVGPARTTTRINLRKAPRISAQIIMVIPEGAKVRVRGRPSNGYYPIGFAGQRGWGYGEYLEPYTVEVLPEGPGFTTRRAVVRRSPSHEAEALARVPRHTKIRINGRPRNGFYPVTYHDVDGWASAARLDAGHPPENPRIRHQIGIDDYPYKGQRGIDPWRFYKSTCTSFVAWRVNHNLGRKFWNFTGGVAWGDATNWDSAARAAGFRVDEHPTVGSIAQWRAGDAGSWSGHVAFVYAVNPDGSVQIEEYNSATPYGYGKRTVRAPRYIHIVD
jgi:surface antigen/uncharacterized protein YraI